MKSYPGKSKLFAFFLVLLTGILFLAGCRFDGSKLIQEYFPLPSAWVFPTLTPRPTHTVTISVTPTRTSTLVPTEITPARAGTALPLPWQGIQPENVSQIDLIVESGKGIPQQIALAPDGSLIAVATTNGVYLHNAVSLQEQISLHTYDLQHCVAISTGNLIASGDRHGGVSIWDAAGEIQMHFSTGSLPVLALAFSPDAAYLAASTWNGELQLWRTEDGALWRTFQVRLRATRSLAFSADGGLLYAWAPKESVQVWSLTEGSALEDIYIGKDNRGLLPIEGKFGQNGALFAASYGANIRIYRASNGTILRTFNLPAAAQTSALSADGSLLAAVQPANAQIWDLETGTLLAEYPLAETDTPHLAAFSPEGNTLITLGSSLQRWTLPESTADEPVTGNTSGIKEFHSTIVTSSLAADGGRLFFAGLSGRLDVYQVEDGSITSLIAPSGIDLTSFAMIPGKLAAFGSQPGNIILQEIGAEEPETLVAHRGPVRSLAFSADGRLLASGGEDGLVLVWQIDERSILYRFEHDSAPQAILFTPENSSLIVRTRAGIQIWSLDEQAVEQTIPGFGMALSADGIILAAASQSYDIAQVELYRLPAGDLIGTLPLEGSRLALSPDHRLLAIAGKDLTLWSVIDGSLLHRVPDLQVFGSLQFSPDGKWLILTAWDGSVRVWGVPE